VNTIWEGADNILCLDVRRAIERDDAHVPFLARLRDAVAQAPPGDDATAVLVAARVDDLEEAIGRWQALDRTTAEARLFPLAQFMVDVYAAALLVEQAGWEHANGGSARKALIARLYARAHLADGGRFGGVDTPPEELERFKDLCEGTLIDDLPGGAVSA
jgi:hypothetical protein